MTGWIASKLTTNSQCTHWVNVPLPPVFPGLPNDLGILGPLSLLAIPGVLGDHPRSPTTTFIDTRHSNSLHSVCTDLFRHCARTFGSLRTDHVWWCLVGSGGGDCDEA